MEAKARKKRKPSSGVVLMTHWCGGRVVRDGHRGIKCLKCGRVGFLTELTFHEAD